MKKQMASILLVLLTVHVSSAAVSFTPVYLTIVQPSEYYYEVVSFTSQNDNAWRNYGNLNKTVNLVNFYKKWFEERLLRFLPKDK